MAARLSLLLPKTTTTRTATTNPSARTKEDVCVVRMAGGHLARHFGPVRGSLQQGIATYPQSLCAVVFRNDYPRSWPVITRMMASLMRPCCGRARCPRPNRSSATFAAVTVGRVCAARSVAYPPMLPTATSSSKGEQQPRGARQRAAKNHLACLTTRETRNYPFPRCSRVVSQCVMSFRCRPSCETGNRRW